MRQWGALNPEQRLAVETLHGPVLVLAGAGTGKTRVITCRIANLIAHDVPPDRILAVTFTNKAAREMQQRVTQLVGSRLTANAGAGPRCPTICTFHSLGVRILRRHIDRLGYKPNFVIYDETEQLGVIRKILSRISGDGASQDPAAVLGLLSRYRNGGARAAAFADPAVGAMAEHVQRHYQGALRACNAVDFDDLILLTLRLLADHPDVLDECRDCYRYVLVDEYQDTNAAQYQLLRALTNQHRNLCVVGDDDQSIYGWRGAEIANLLELEQHYPEVKIIKLERNYRSTTTILDAANALIRHNARRRPKRLHSRKGSGSRLRLYTFADEEDEARGLVEAIEHARLLRRTAWSQVAILLRTNSQSRPFETALRQARIPYRLVGAHSFFDRREVRDALAYLKALVNPQDDISLLRIANVPSRGLSEATMEHFLALSHERNLTVFQAMRDAASSAVLPTRARESAVAFVQLLEEARGQLAAETRSPLGVWAEAFFDRIGYFEEVRRSEKNPETAAGRLQNLRDLLAGLDGTAAQGSGIGRLQAALEELTLDTERDELDDEPKRGVTVITMHSCKGLEFPHVYLAGVEEGLLPHARSVAEGSFDEERRLFYVAITRAMETLALSYCQSRKRFGQLVPAHPSRFLQELPAELLEIVDLKSSAPVSVQQGRRLFAEVHAALDAGP
jgi:superfamily I DNA/RNA helicase